MARSVAGGEKQEASGSHTEMLLDLRMVSAWSRSWSLSTPPSETGTGGGEGVLSSRLGGLGGITGGAGGGVTRGADGCATPTPGLQCCLAATTAWGGGGRC